MVLVGCMSAKPYYINSDQYMESGLNSLQDYSHTMLKSDVSIEIVRVDGTVVWKSGEQLNYSSPSLFASFKQVNRSLKDVNGGSLFSGRFPVARNHLLVVSNTRSEHLVF